MPIPFLCPNCGASLTAPDEFAGGRAKCATCGQPVRIPRPATIQTHQLPTGRPTRDTLFILGVVSAAVVVLIGSATILVHKKRVEERRRKEYLIAVMSSLDTSIAKAGALAAAFKFDDAAARLEGIRATVSGAADWELSDKYRGAVSRFRTARADYETKVKEGWSHFEGRFVSSDEKIRVLAARRREQELREAEAKRLEEERLRKEEERRREVEEQRLAEERRRQEEALRRKQVEIAREQREKLQQTPEYQLATLNDPGRVVPLDDRTVKRFAFLLDRVSQKAGDTVDRADIAAKTHAGWKLLNGRGDSITLLQMMEEINQSMEPGVANQFIYSDIVTMYVLLRLGG